jgi:glycosyltransferase involved in cell wall biosynthesis
MCPEKGIPAAIGAARLAGIPLQIAAKMSEPAEILYFDRVVRPLLGGDIQYIGEVASKAKLALLGNATCLLNPIAWPEPFGMVMLESLACGTPVVTTPMGAAPEIVDHGRTGFICSDEKSLASALKAVGSLSREACREVARTRFSSDRMVARHVRVYEQLAQRRILPRVA